jgi:hypothetical protein
MDQLLGQLQRELASPPPAERICDGTLFSRQQYLMDVTEWDFADGRLAHGYMTPEQIEEFTAGILEDGQPSDPRQITEIERKLHERLHERLHEQGV